MSDRVLCSPLAAERVLCHLSSLLRSLTLPRGVAGSVNRAIAATKTSLAKANASCQQLQLLLVDSSAKGIQAPNPSFEDELKKLRVKLKDELERSRDLQDTLVKTSEELSSLTVRHQDLIAERERLHHQLLEASVERGALSKRLAKFEDHHEVGDPELLSIAYRKCKEQLSSKERSLYLMEVQYRSVVPRSLYRQCSAKLSSISASHSRLTYRHSDLLREHRNIAEKHLKAVVERDRLAAENMSLRRSATPRPNWDRVSEHIEGGISKWREVTQDCHSSEDFLQCLVAELTGLEITDAEEIITCKGTGPLVPAYLRHEGAVRNRKLNKRDTLLLISDIWCAKKETAAQREMPLAEFLEAYFRERYPIASMRAEWCYSLADACQRLAHEEQIGLFWGIACGQVQEKVYHHQADTIAKIKATLAKYDLQNKDLLPITTVEDLLTKMFPLKEEDDLQELFSTAKRLATSSKDPTKMRVSALTWPRADGSPSDFVQELVQQLRSEQEAYVQEVLQEVSRNGAVDVKRQELQRAFTVVDPAIEQKELQAYLSWVFARQSCPGEAISLPLLAARLQTGHIVRVGPKM